jgi:DNA-binding PadR family transcriptional regulator
VAQALRESGQHLTLLAVLRLGDDAYGTRVRREIAERTKRDVTIGAVYTTLDRLAAKGLLKSALSDPTPERGGRAKRSFRVTGLGIVSLKSIVRGRNWAKCSKASRFRCPGARDEAAAAGSSLIDDGRRPLRGRIRRRRSGRRAKS